MTSAARPVILATVLVLLAAVMVVVAAYQGAQALVPDPAASACSAYPAAHPRDVAAGHAGMAVAMAAMALLAYPVSLAGGLTLVCLGAVLWCALQVLRGHARGAHLRLGVGLVAMAGMLAGPLTVPGALAAPVHDHHAHVHAAGSGLPHAFVLLLAAALVAVAAAAVLRLLRSRGGSRRGRLDCCCEVAMAWAMTLMLVGTP